MQPAAAGPAAAPGSAALFQADQNRRETRQYSASPGGPDTWRTDAAGSIRPDTGS